MSTLTPSSSASTALALLKGNARVRLDPLALFRFASHAQRKLVLYLSKGLEVLFRAGNSSGKTWIGGAVAVALLRGLKELGGVKLPEIQTPCVGWCIVQTYKGQVDGAQAAVLAWLGDWPHKIIYVRSEAVGWIDTIWVATDRCTHGNGEKCATCSKLVFHCSESESSVGGRVHFVWADEPPNKTTWDECRQRGTAKQLLIRWITATPKEKSWWWWMPADFHDCEDNPRGGFVEIRSSIMDNTALAPEVVEQKVAAAAKDERPQAVLKGEYVDLKGECPFPPDKLEAWLKRCRPPKLEQVVVRAERRTAEGDVEVPVSCEVEIYHEFDPEETYVGIIDPATFLRLDSQTGLVARRWAREGSSSRGVPDPCGVHIYARRKRRLVARFSGYSGGHGVGSLGGILAKRYGNALMDLDMTGGHGEAAFRALAKSGHRNINAFDQKASQMHAGAQRFGFTMNPTNRSEVVAAIQQALIAGNLLCESEECVRSLMAVTYAITPTGKEKPEASYGSKDEDMTCMGRALHLMDTLPLPAVRVAKAEERIAQMLGKPLLIPRKIHRGARKISWSPGR